MSEDITIVNAESTSEKNQDVKPLLNQQNNGNGPPQQRGYGGGGFRRGGPGGQQGNYNRFGGARRPNPNPNPRNPEDRKRFRPNNYQPGERPPPEVLMKSQDRFINEKLDQISGPSVDLPPLDHSDKKFTGRCRLYVGNLPPEINDDELSELFKKYGEVNELFVNKEKHFGFIRLDYHFNAEKAKNELNGTVLKGKNLKIRFAPNGSTLKIKNIDEFVTNELLHASFSVFGEVERCVAIVDDRGKPIGEGIVEFARKNAALLALRKCNENCFFLTSTLRPCIVEMFDAIDDVDGHSEKMINKRHPEYFNRRSVGPRFAQINSFEHEYGLRWKNLHEMFTQKVDNLKKELLIDQDKLVAQMELARYEHETAMLRDKLRSREMDMDRQKKEWEMREQQADEARRMNDQEMRQQEKDMQAKMMHQDEELRRRQEENKLFMQAQQLDNMLNHQEQVNTNFDEHSGNLDVQQKLSNFKQAYEQGDDRFERKETDMEGGGFNRFEQHERGGYQGFRGGNRWGDNRPEMRRRRF